MEKRILDLICCPKCHGDFRLMIIDKGKERIEKLFCKDCTKEYIIKDDIPILIDEDF